MFNQNPPACPIIIHAGISCLVMKSPTSLSQSLQIFRDFIQIPRKKIKKEKKEKYTKTKEDQETGMRSRQTAGDYIESRREQLS